MPKVGKQDVFEQVYTKRFEALAAPHGMFVKYELDRAALDLGLHLTSPAADGHRAVTDRRIWFQLKGVRQDSLAVEEFEKQDAVPLDLPVEDIRLWYGSPEVVYIVVYIESVDAFLAEDIRDIVDRQWGTTVFGDKALRPDQKTARVHVLKTARLDEGCWREMMRHRSMRIDGPLFRGRPLGHRLDPLRCTLEQMDPNAFHAMIHRLLDVHDFRITQQLDARQLFRDPSSGDEADLFLGHMYHTFEWTCQMFTELMFDEGSEFREEGQPFCVQGPCAVLIHSKRCSSPDTEGLRSIAKGLLDRREIKKLLVFANDNVPPKYIGSFRGIVVDMGLSCLPQDLSDIPYNLLTATAVYLEFRDKIKWKSIEYLK